MRRLRHKRKAIFVLQAAHDFYTAAPGRRVRQYPAKSASGKVVAPFSREAEKFCLAVLVDTIINDLRLGDAVAFTVKHRLNQVVSRYRKGSIYGITSFNDSNQTSTEDVLEVIRRAIAVLEKEIEDGK